MSDQGTQLRPELKSLLKIASTNVNRKSALVRAAEKASPSSEVGQDLPQRIKAHEAAKAHS